MVCSLLHKLSREEKAVTFGKEPRDLGPLHSVELKRRLAKACWNPGWDKGSNLPFGGPFIQEIEDSSKTTILGSLWGRDRRGIWHIAAYPTILPGRGGQPCKEKAPASQKPRPSQRAGGLNASSGPLCAWPKGRDHRKAS
jgi:hypothetical protein